MILTLLLGVSLVPATFAATNEYTIKDGSDVTLILPPFWECGKYSIVDPGDRTVVDIESDSQWIPKYPFQNRVYVEVLANRSFSLTLKALRESERGSYQLKTIDQQMALKPACQQYYNINFVQTGALKYWLGWEAWSSCSVTCDRGTRVRIRTCSVPSMCGPEGARQEEPCGSVACADPVPRGEWIAWSQWGLCTGTCNVGERKRERLCIDRTTNQQTSDCPGMTSETERCRLRQTCPPIIISSTTTRQSIMTSSANRPGWGEWSDWSSCTQSCGTGMQLRMRACLSDVIDDCVGNHNETRTCNTQACDGSRQTSADTDEPSVPLWAVVGGGCAMLIVLLLIVVLVLLWRLKKKKRNVRLSKSDFQQEHLNKERHRKKVISCDVSDGGYAEIKDVICVEPLDDVKAHDYVKLEANEGKTKTGFGVTHPSVSNATYDTPKSMTLPILQNTNVSNVSRSHTIGHFNKMAPIQSEPVYLNGSYSAEDAEKFYVTPKLPRKTEPVYDTPRKCS